MDQISQCMFWGHFGREQISDKGNYCLGLTIGLNQGHTPRCLSISTPFIASLTQFSYAFHLSSH